jgi:hypothetical protein
MMWLLVDCLPTKRLSHDLTVHLSGTLGITLQSLTRLSYCHQMAAAACTSSWSAASVWTPMSRSRRTRTRFAGSSRRLVDGLTLAGPNRTGFGGGFSSDCATGSVQLLVLLAVQLPST